MDKDLIQRLVIKDEQAFELLFRRYYSMLCHFATRFIHDQEMAEDIVQEVFYKLWRNPSNLDSKQNIASYLIRAVQNQGLNILDHQLIEKKYAEVILNANFNSNDFSLYEQVFGQELEEKIQRVIVEKLPEACRNVFELSRNESLKYKEIAEKLNISIKTVETQISRALVVLRNELKEYITFIIAIILLNQ
ncbi:MAG: RNA polymerase sigma-70 factor [Bacteroidales bacterium]|nr:RNA polymerase sigma-70 factor [Bacteroidales bacterium]MCF8455568.1 RNA polymerase sigma-70 factor [Bacteroidales bacterium]